MDQTQKENLLKSSLSENEYLLLEELKKAVAAAGYVVELIESESDSNNHFHGADWLGIAMHAYGAMNFVNSASKAINKIEKPILNLF